MPRSTFEDRTPVTVTFETDKGALAALKDNPLRLNEDVEGSWFGNAVRRGCRHLDAAVSQDDRDQYNIRVCLGCGCPLGATIVAIRITTCPDCGARCVPVEDKTRSVNVVAA